MLCLNQKGPDTAISGRGTAGRTGVACGRDCKSMERNRASFSHITHRLKKPSKKPNSPFFLERSLSSSSLHRFQNPARYLCGLVGGRSPVSLMLLLEEGTKIY